MTGKGLLQSFVGSIIEDRKGRIWFGHPEVNLAGVSCLDRDLFSYYTQQDGLNSDYVYCMLEDRAGNLWFGSVDRGVCRYDGTSFTNLSENGSRR